MNFRANVNGSVIFIDPLASAQYFFLYKKKIKKEVEIFENLKSSPMLAVFKDL